MWLSFFACALFALAVLFIPGFVIGKALRLPSLVTVACAPLMSMGAIGLTAVVLKIIECPAPWWALVIPLPIIALLCVIAFSCIIKHRHACVRATRKDWALLGAYVAVGVIVTSFVFLRNIDGPDAYMLSFDSIVHFSVARNFIDTGFWSPLSTAIWSQPELFEEGGRLAFYPAAWHQLVALAVAAANCDMAIAVNACNAVITGVVFPCGSFLLLYALFPRKTAVLACGAVATMSFALVPWFMVYRGIVYANLFGNSMLPAYLGIFIYLTRADQLTRSNVIRLVVFSVFALPALAFAHTSTLFAAYVFLVPYLCARIWQMLAASEKHNSIKTRIIAVALFLVAALAIWVAMTKAPALSGTVNYANHRKQIPDYFSAISSALSLSFTVGVPQFPLAVCTVLGALYVCVKKKFWLIAPSAYMLAAFVVCRCYGGHFKSYLTGFWYNDPWRIAYLSELYLIPIAAIGLACIVKLCLFLLSKISEPKQKEPANQHKRLSSALCLGVVLALFSSLNFHLPLSSEDQSGTNAFAYAELQIASQSNMKVEKSYSAKEREFVQKAVDLLPEGAIVINQPQDGSVFAHGLDDMQTYYRRTSIDYLDENGEAFRTNLADAESDPKVQSALERTGARYVLLLDQNVPIENSASWMPRYSSGDQSAWRGIDDITDNTPGFEPILAEDDMRLYKITALD